MKKILCLDFDGVCTKYAGWKGAAVCADPPVDGLFEFLRAAAPHFDIQVFSSRSRQPGGTVAMRGWFDEQWKRWCSTQPVLEGSEMWVPFCPWITCFPDEKPSAFITLDDRGWLFTGTWPDIEQMLVFKNWLGR